MADHRKSIRPRRLTFDGRLLPRGRLIGAVLGLLGALAPVPAFAQDIGLKNGEASLAAGKYETAARQLSATVNDEDSTPGQAAKALYLRGVAYRKMGQPGRAIADLGAAVWLGLPTSDRVRALVNKGLAYRAAGLASQGEAAMSEARKASSASEVDRLIAEDGGPAVASAESAPVSTETSTAGQSSSGSSVWSRLVPSFGSSSSPPPPTPPAPEPSETRTAAAAPSSGWSASVSDDTAEESGSRVGRWFGSLTGDSAPAPAAAPGPANPIPAPTSTSRTTTATRTAPEPETAVAPPSAASWAANTETEKVVSDSDGGGTAFGRLFSRSTDAAPAPAASPPPRGTGYTVQLANSGSEAEAKALLKQVQRSNSQVASASPRIEKVDIGSFGTFYAIKMGPFADQAEGTKLCNALKRSGTDCSVVSPDGP